MTRLPTEQELSEVYGLIDSLTNRTVVSRGYIEDIIFADPARFPAMVALPEKIRKDVISQIMNRRFSLRNQTGQKPKYRVWNLNNKKGVCSASC